jgi:sugar diacid utilization regulator
VPGLGLSLAIFGRAGLVGITDQPFEVYSYTELLGKEAEVVTDMVGLDANAVNDALDRLERFGGRVRTVIVPTG